MITLQAGLFVDPPRDAVAQYTWAPLLIAISIAVVSLIVGVIYTRRTRSPLYVWLAVSGGAACTFLYEPLGDFLIAMWYPANMPGPAAPFGRPMPWFVFLFYLGAVPLAGTGMWELVKRGVSARWLLGATAVISVLEVPLEMVGGQLSWMMYYANHATFFSVPIYCIPQNGGVFLTMGVLIAWLMPYLRGWRWALLPLAMALLPALAAVATIPAYLAIHLEAGPLWGWIGGIAAFILNVLLLVAFAHLPVLERYRVAAAARQSATADPTAPATA